MEKKTDIKGILLVIFIVISIALAGFIVYDKFIKNNNDEDCNDTGCIFSIDHMVAEKYVNEGDNESYITFDNTNKTWKFYRNECHGYLDYQGTFTITDDKVLLKSSDGWESVLTIQSDGKLYSTFMTYPDNNDEVLFAGCTDSSYFKESK